MTTITTDAPRTGAARSGWARLPAPLGGLALVAGLIALMASPMGDDAGETPAEVVAYTSAHEGWIVATLLFGLAALALGGVFVAGVSARLRGLATPVESTLVLVGGTAFTLCFTLFLTVWTAPLADTPGDRAQALAQAQAYLAFDDIGWFLLGAAGVAATVLTVPASLAAMRGGLPAWLGWLGVVAGLAAAATVAFFGLFAWMAWIAVASVVLLVSPVEDR